MVFYNLCNLFYDIVFFFFSSFYKFCCYLFMYLLTIKKLQFYCFCCFVLVLIDFILCCVSLSLF